MHISAAVEFSAKKGNGIGDLCKSVKSILMKSDEENRNQTGLGSDRQKKSVEEALERVNHALLAAESDFALDAVVQDLEDSLDSLGEVTGEVTPDDILESIFSNFCVGK
jgi:tRNA modification GTPase